jgi:hypothetical protein
MLLAYLAAAQQKRPSRVRESRQKGFVRQQQVVVGNC